jgi:hypothetical protein
MNELFASMAREESRLLAVGALPAGEHRCECGHDSVRQPEWDGGYLPEEEKARDHRPDACPGTFGLHRYERDGRVVVLCSACHRKTDRRLP